MFPGGFGAKNIKTRTVPNSISINEIKASANGRHLYPHGVHIMKISIYLKQDSKQNTYVITQFQAINVVLFFSAKSI